MRSALRPRSFQPRPLALTSSRRGALPGACVQRRRRPCVLFISILCCPTASEAMHGLGQRYTLLPIPRQAISILRPVERDGTFGNLAHR